jgi:ribosomal-protein-alanine N-acetyltransferase
VRLPAETPRLTFRWWQKDDAPLARALWGDPKVVAKLGSFDAEARLGAELSLAREHGVQYWPIFLRDGGKHAGVCGLRPKAPGVLELGFHLVPACWGKGLAVEAARAVIAHAFGVLKVERLFAGHHPENAASKRTLERLGFRYTHDEPYAATGLRHPSYELVAP